MANRYGWSKAFKTETMTVTLNRPIKLGTTETAGTTTAGLIFTEADPLVGRLISIVRATGIPSFVADVAAASALDFKTTDLYLVSERAYDGNNFLIGYPIREKAHLNNIELRTVFDDLLGQFYTTVASGRTN